MIVPRSLVAASALAALTACVGAPSFPSSAPSPSASPSGINELLGTEWTWGESAAVPEHPQTGTVLYAFSREGEALVLSRKEPCAGTVERTRGTLEASKLRLVGETLRFGEEPTPVTFELGYDPAAKRLQGTRNGQPFWLAPADEQAVRQGGQPLCTTAVAGDVYDVAGKRLSGVRVRVFSLNPSNPFDATVEAPTGRYVVRQVPPGVELEVTASAPGFSSRTRRVTLLPVQGGTYVHFGGPGASADPGSAGEGLQPAS